MLYQYWFTVFSVLPVSYLDINASLYLFVLLLSSFLLFSPLRSLLPLPTPPLHFSSPLPPLPPPSSPSSSPLSLSIFLSFPLLLSHPLSSPLLLSSSPLLARYSRNEAPSIEARSVDKRGRSAEYSSFFYLSLLRTGICQEYSFPS